MYLSIGLTQQFKFCPNAFRIDTYRDCTYGCKYCFARAVPIRDFTDRNDELDVVGLEKLFDKALSTDIESKNSTIELLRHRVPLHCGGLADPFQKAEWDLHYTYKLIELSNKYNYPISFSTKTEHLPDEYLAILNPDIHAFQVSILGLTDDFVSKYEACTSPPKQRADFIKHLRGLGFWCSLRIQPIIDVDEAELLLHYLKSYPSYVTLEHIKVSMQSPKMVELFNDILQSTEWDMGTSTFAYKEFKTFIKKKNVERLTKIANSYGVLVGVGDNDLHWMSQSRCCCGIDTINDNFNGYLKYNSTYFSTGDYTLKEWAPESSLPRCFKEGLCAKDFTFKQEVKDYIQAHPQFLNPLTRDKLNKDLFGITKKKLF